jgi:hypothetical protein
MYDLALWINRSGKSIIRQIENFANRNAGYSLKRKVNNQCNKLIT